MYVIIVYDVDERRVLKVNKFLKRYLIWTQNSVFEGEISISLLEKVIVGLNKIIEDKDTIIVYKLKSDVYLERLMLGKISENTNNVL
ncbi:MAG: CRISPR-associated endonuclease Cas2 [Thermoplasmata archaeon]